jgi:Mg-chelatase subunit ChlD
MCHTPDSVNVSLVTFSNFATVKVGLTDNEATIDNAVADLKAEGGTNWEDALETASNIKTREGASVSVVFVSDGDPTLRNSRGNGDRSYPNS